MASSDNRSANPFLTESEEKSVSSPVAVPKIPPVPEEVSSRPSVAPTNKTPGVPSQTISIPGPKFEAKKEFVTPPAPSRKKWVKWGVVVLLVLLIALGMYWWWQRPVGTEDEPVAEETPTTSSPTPIVTEEVPPALLDDTASYRSENFKAGEIVLLGEAEFLLGDEGIEPLMLEAIRGEAFTEKNKQEVKLVITWKTNKLSSAEIAYAKGIGQTPKTVTEDDYSYNHSMILTGLDPASTYLYTVKATDRFGNVVTSEPYAVFTGARSVSLFDLIAGAIGDVFGWAVK